MTAIIIRNQQNKDHCLAIVGRLQLASPWHIEIKPYKKTRSLAQNSLYWKWVDCIRLHVMDSTGVVATKDDVHAELGNKFLLTEAGVTLKGEATHRVASTTRLNTADFTAYLEQIDAYCADSLGLILPHPEDLFYEAMGRG